MENLKKLIGPFFIYLTVFFLLPVLDIHVLKFTHDGFAMVIIYLLFLNSLTVILISGYESFRYGWKSSYHIILMAIMYSISCFIVYNSSALIYLVWYLVMAAAGSLAGVLLKKGRSSWKKEA